MGGISGPRHHGMLPGRQVGLGSVRRPLILCVQGANSHGISAPLNQRTYEVAVAMTPNLQVIAALASAVAAICTLGIAIAVYRFSRQQHATQMRTQRAVQVHEWSNECLRTMTEAEHFFLLEEACFPDSGAYRMRQNDLLHRLSALIEQGRLFFRNVDQHKSGLESFPARRGYRPEVLDPLVAAYEAVRTEKVAFLPEWRARFVSLIQYEVDAEWLRKAVHYQPVGPGAGAGIWVRGSSDGPPEPPPWPEDRPPA